MLPDDLLTLSLYGTRSQKGPMVEGSMVEHNNLPINVNPTAAPTVHNEAEHASYRDHTTRRMVDWDTSSLIFTNLNE
ncbi:hypothetical protein N7530_003329 [Penicillium desertorum]|uniref:Uncharacterized protein n=1 Tax=Penicillium desertorum TaxID=1303715 RepID=A0A9W9WWH4_9EURO|nr:hypothetical protein N7530_003329 [Penicillium desertorum]